MGDFKPPGEPLLNLIDAHISWAQREARAVSRRLFKSDLGLMDFSKWRGGTWSDESKSALRSQIRVTKRLLAAFTFSGQHPLHENKTGGHSVRRAGWASYEPLDEAAWNKSGKPIVSSLHRYLVYLQALDVEASDFLRQQAAESLSPNSSRTVAGQNPLRRLGQLFGARPTLRNRVDSEGFFNLATLDSAIVLAHWPSGLRLSQVHLQDAGGAKFRQSPEVNRAIGRRKSAYEGKNKLFVRSWSGGNSDVADLTLSGISVHPGLVKVTHENFGLIEGQVGHPLEIANLSKSMIPNFLVQHVMSTTADNVIVIGRRRENIDYYPLHWTVSWEEQVNIDADNWSLEAALLRGLKEEIVGDVKDAVDLSAARVLALAREFDDQLPAFGKEGVKQVVALLNLFIYAPLKLSFQDVLANRGRPVDRPHEFVDVAGIGLSWVNLRHLLQAPSFDFSQLPGEVFFEGGTHEAHLKLGPQLLHPTARARLLTFAAHHFPSELAKLLSEG